MKERHLTANPRVPCQVSLGMFSTEREVRIDLPSGREVSALVDKSQVITEKEPDPGTSVPGFVRVSIVSYLDHSVTIDLPQGGLGNGSRFIVPRSFLKYGRSLLHESG